MVWTPEALVGLFAAVGAMVLTFAAILNKIGLVKIPWRSNGVQKITLKDCSECKEKLTGKMASFHEQQRLHMQKHEDTSRRLDNGDMDFKEIKKEIAELNKNVILIGTKAQAREDRNITVIKECIEIMQKVSMRLAANG